jgi:hypothetical protein
MKKVLLMTLNGNFFFKPAGRYFVLIFLILLSFNTSGQKIQSELIEVWTNGVWRNSLTDSYTYDDNGFLVTLTNKEWNLQLNSWIDASKTYFSNSPDGSLDHFITQIYDPDEPGWINAQRVSYTYNASGKPLTVISENWTGLEWRNFMMMTNTYDANGYLVNTLSQAFYAISPSWINSSQTNYTNNPDGTVNQSVMQTWDGVSAWTNSRRSTYTYNPSGKALTDLTELWLGSAWLNNNLETNTYDGSNYLTNSLNQTWDLMLSSWKDNSLEIYSNNPDGTPYQILSQSWNPATPGWDNEEKITFTYGLPTGSYDIPGKPDIIVYPNPSDNIITVRTADIIPVSKFTITDQTGRVVLTGLLSGETTTINISLLSNGMYFLQVGGKFKKTLKILKK